MSNLDRFLKQNKIIKPNTVYRATASIVDENGEPMEWVIKPLTTVESEAIREQCTKDVPVNRKPGLFTQKVDPREYTAKLMVASILEPNMYDAELQDSYGVKTPEDLLRQMVDDPGEYNAFGMFIFEYNNLTKTLEGQVEEAKK